MYIICTFRVNDLRRLLAGGGSPLVGPFVESALSALSPPNKNKKRENYEEERNSERSGARLIAQLLAPSLGLRHLPKN